MPLLTELKNVLERVSTKMSPLTGLDGCSDNLSEQTASELNVHIILWTKYFARRRVKNMNRDGLQSTPCITCYAMRKTMRKKKTFAITLLALVLCVSQTFAETIDVRLRILNKSSDEKIITRTNLIKIKQFILKQGFRETYCNMYGNNPAYRTKNFSFYLNPDSGQANINCETNKSDFHVLTIRKTEGGKNQYRTVEFLDADYVDIVSSWPTDDLTVDQIRICVIDALTEILPIIEKENKANAGDGK